MWLQKARQSKALKLPETWTDLVGANNSQECKIQLETAIAPLLENVFGRYLVKVGDLSSEINVPSCRVKHHIHLRSSAPVYTPKHSVESKAELNSHSTSTTSLSTVSKPLELPLQTNSVDAFLLVHQLDFAQDPHKLLRELDRCITPDGHVIIVGFNPFSAAYLANSIPFVSRDPIANARFFSTMRIKDWLGLLNYEVIEQAPITHRAFVFDQWIKSKGRSSLALMPDKAKHWFSSFASVYVIVAQKREAKVIMPKRHWKLSPKFNTATAASRVSSRRKSEFT